ncbi:MAG: hypothetical protein ACTSRG_07685 [Candidatus Helarchaeota archaeon]
MTQERKTIAVNKEIAEKLAEIAKRDGMTLFSLINEILETAIYTQESKLGKCSEIVNKYEDIMVAKDIGMVFVPIKLENMVNKLAFSTEGWDQLLNEWYNYGKWVANYTKVRYPGEEMKMINKVNQTIFWTNTDIEIRSIPNEKNPKEVELRIFGQDLEIEYLECIVNAFEGIFHELGFKTSNKEVSEGICLLHLKV